MKNTSYILSTQKSHLFRGLIGIVTVLLFTVKLASSFLHTHQFEESSSKIASISSVHCDACEYEATQAIEPGAAILLPSDCFCYETKIYQSISVFVSAPHSSSESRGPPFGKG